MPFLNFKPKSKILNFLCLNFSFKNQTFPSPSTPEHKNVPKISINQFTLTKLKFIFYLFMRERLHHNNSCLIIFWEAHFSLPLSSVLNFYAIAHLHSFSYECNNFFPQLGRIESGGFVCGMMRIILIPSIDIMLRFVLSGIHTILYRTNTHMNALSQTKIDRCFYRCMGDSLSWWEIFQEWSSMVVFD